MNMRYNFKYVSVWIYQFEADKSIASNVKFRKRHNVKFRKRHDHGEFVPFPWQCFVKI